MSQRTFTLFHFNLIPISQPKLTVRKDDTREAWLRYALKNTFEFEHRGGAILHWVPQGDAGECLLGMIQRTRLHERHKPPEEGGGEIAEEEWQGAYVLVDPTHHHEGQRLAVENDVVGKPSSLVKSLSDHLNRHEEAPYQIEIEPLWDSSRFWAFAERHGNLLRRIDFNFVVPNMWDTERDLDEDLKDTGHKTGAERVRVGLDSAHGVSTDNQKVRDGVEYAERGAGSLTAKAMDNTPFRSTKTPLVSKIPAVKAGAEEMVKLFNSLKEKILRRAESDTMDDSDRNANRPADD